MLTVEFAKEGHIPSGRSEAFEITFVKDAIASGIPTANKHSAIPKTGDEATVVDLSEHGIITAVFEVFAKEGHIPSGRSEAFEITFVSDAITSGIHIANTHNAHHHAGDESAYIVEAVHGEITFEHAHEFMAEGDAPPGRAGEIHDITFVYDAIHMVNTESDAS